MKKSALLIFVFGIIQNLLGFDRGHYEAFLVSYPDSALKLLNKELRSDVPKDKRTEAEIQFLMGQIFYNSGLFYKSLLQFQEAEKLALLSDDVTLLSEIKVESSKTYYYLKQPETALLKLRETEQILKNVKLSDKLADVYTAMGRIYEKKGDFDTSLSYQYRALKIYQKFKNQKGIAMTYNSIGTVYEDKEMHDSAFYFFNAAYLINKGLENYDQLIINLNNIGDSYRKRGIMDSAILYSNLALDLAKKKGFKYQVSTVLRDLAKAYLLLNNFEKAYEYEHESRNIYNEIYSKDLNEQIALLQTLYEVDAKNEQIYTLEKEQKLQRNVNIAVIIAVIALLVSLSLLFSRQRLKWKAKQRMFENEMKIAESRKEFLESEEKRLSIELKHKKLEEQYLNSEYYALQKEFTARMMQSVEKDNLIKEIQNRLTQIIEKPKDNVQFEIIKAVRMIEQNSANNTFWDDFLQHYDFLNFAFIEKLKKLSPEITQSEIKVCALIRQNLPSEKIASILNISKESLRVSKYRIKKKLNIGTDVKLSSFLLTI
jgi:tetratricopeptide (TPR) repeat protein